MADISERRQFQVGDLLFWRYRKYTTSENAPISTKDAHTTDFWDGVGIIIEISKDETIHTILAVSNGLLYNPELTTLKELLKDNKHGKINHYTFASLKRPLREDCVVHLAKNAPTLVGKNCCDKPICALVTILDSISLLNDLYGPMEKDGSAYLSKTPTDVYINVSRKRVCMFIINNETETIEEDKIWNIDTEIYTNEVTP